MAEPLVKFSLLRLKSLVLHDREIFSGLEGQTKSIISVLDDISQFCDSVDRTTDKNYKFESSWFKILRDIIHEMEDNINEFIIRMEKDSGPDQITTKDLCRAELVKMHEMLVRVLNSMSEDLKGKEADDQNQEAKESSLVDEGEASSSPTPTKFYHINIPYYLRSCLIYCGIFPEGYEIPRGRLVRLLVAEGLVQEKTGQIPEEIAEENINSLVEVRLLLVVNGAKLKLNDQIREFVKGMMAQEDLLVSCITSDTEVPPTTRRLSIHSNTNNIPTNLNNLPIQSLFLFGISGLSSSEFDFLRPIYLGKKFVRVLDLEGVLIETLPGEIGELIHLKYLGLKKSNIGELPESVGNLRNLQTLDVSWNTLLTLPIGILNLVELRHLKFFKGASGTVQIPLGIGCLENLQTCTGLSAGGGLAAELGKLTQLRKLGIMDLIEEDVNEVCTSIMKMEGLISLSLTSKGHYPTALLPSTEPFSPPSALQKLRLEGRLERLPTWFSMLANLMKLRLGFSNLSEDPALVLQFLPNLKHLTLWRAYEGTIIGKEFCGVGGFPKLEVLVIASHVLEEWTEVEVGALPSLRCLHLHNCLRLRTLPEGLQHVTSLQELNLLPLLDDHAERLKPEGGQENYKISHIPVISFLTTSTLQQLAQGHPAAERA